MSAKTTNFAALLVLANYLLALTWAGLFHEHSGPNCPGQHTHSESPISHHSIDCRHECDSAQNTCDHPHDGVEEKPLPSIDGESCPVCQFLGQKPIAPSGAVEETSSPLDEDPAPVRPVRPVAPAASTRHIRGPPAVA